MFSSRWITYIIYSIYTWIQINTNTKANTLNFMPHAFTCQAAPPSDCSCFCSYCSSFFTFLLTVNIFVAFCLFCLYRLCSARCFLCNISTLQQRAKTLTLFTFTFSFCFVLFPAFLLHDANWLPAWVQVQCCAGAAQCTATFTAHFGLCLSAAAAALGKRLSSKSCVASGVARTQKDPESVSENIKTPHWRLLSTKWC